LRIKKVVYQAEILVLGIRPHQNDTQMTDYTVAIYCFLDDYLKICHRKEDKRRKVTNAEILTTVLLAARYFHGNFVSARKYMIEHHGMKRLHKSNFNRQVHKLSQTISAIFFALGQSLKELNVESRYAIDSFPVAVCKNIRIKRCKLLQGEAYRGYNTSKREYFYGFKVQVITTMQGIPVDYFIVAGSFHDCTAFQAMNIDLPQNSELYADSAYTFYELEDFYEQCDQVFLKVERKSNSTRPDTPAARFLKKLYRKRIETTFSEITARFPKKIHAVTPKGFLIKVVLFLLAFVFDKVNPLSAT